MKNIISCLLLLAFVTFKSYAQKPIEVSKFNFLVFATDQEFEDYGNFLSKSTQGDILKFHESIKFNSKGKASYDEKNVGELATDQQQMDYTLSVDGIVEINGVLMKPIEDNKFLLTMVTSNVNSESYNRLAKGEYDKETMNKFATNRPKKLRIELYEFIKKTPAGYEENEAFPESDNRRPFWGKICGDHTVCIPNAETGGCDTYTGTYCCKYRFWIETSCYWEE